MTEKVKGYYELCKEDDALEEQGKDPNIKERKELLRSMSNDGIDYLIDHAGIGQAKGYYHQFKK